MHDTNEGLRKALHIAFGLFAFTLRWIPWPAAAGICLVAVLGNWLLLHRLVGKGVARHERGYDAGIVLYPFVVLILIVVFRNRIEIAGAVWAILAFGDGFATLAGRAIRGPRVPWNADKSWSGFFAFLAFGFVGAEVVYLWLRTAPTSLPPVLILATTVVIAAIVETLPLNVDDNLTVPAAAAAVMAGLVYATGSPVMGVDVVWLIVNTVLAAAGYLARSVDASGAIAGWVLGSALIVFGGWALYGVLLAFFIIGTAMTKFGYATKARRGLAQEKGGRRGASHAFSNVGVAAILALFSSMRSETSTLLWFAAAAALATATADTVASEVGQLIGRRTFLPLTLRPVPVGTEGAISIEGTLAGLIGGAIVAILTTRMRFGVVDLKTAALLTAAAFIGSYIESLAGSWNRNRTQPVPNGALNFFNTAVGAGAYALLARL